MAAYFYVYILANEHNTVLYVGVTNDLRKRVFQHREKLVKGFTRRFNVGKLVYYEQADDPVSAISREKRIKSWNRTSKVKLVTGFNPGWRDLYDEILS